MNDGNASRRHTIADAAAARPSNVSPSVITGRPQKTAMIVAQRIVNEIQVNKLGAGAKLPSDEDDEQNRNTPSIQKYRPIPSSNGIAPMLLAQSRQ